MSYFLIYIEKMAWRVCRVYIHLLIGGLGVGPAVEIMDIVVSDFLSIAEYLLAVHAQSLMVQAEMFGFQSFGSTHKHEYIHTHTNHPLEVLLSVCQRHSSIT